MTKSERHSASDCPGCGRPLDARRKAGEFNLDKEKDYVPGDLSICLYCSTRLVYNDDLSLRALTESEFDRLPQEAKEQLNIARDRVLRIRLGVEEL